VAGQPLAGPAIAAYASGLWAAFPDLSFEIVSAAPAGDRMIAAQWIMRGTNRASMQGLPPTGRTVALPGADFIQVEGEQVRVRRAVAGAPALLVSGFQLCQNDTCQHPVGGASQRSG
jgi:predicted ester cyclase